MHYKELNEYSKKLINTHYFKKRQKVYTIEPDDMVSEAYARGFDNLDEAKKHIRDYFLTEARRLSSINNHMTDESFSKKCNKCKEHKDSSLYRKRLDKKTGLKYLYYICLDCEKQYSSSKKVRKYENDRIKNNPELRRKKSEYEKKRRLKIKLSKN